MTAAGPPPELILTRRSLESAEMHRVATGAAAVFTTPNPHKDSGNEDAVTVVAVNDTRGILAVADGVGGQRSGAEAAEAALQALVECVTEPATGVGGSLRSAVLDGFERANANVLELGAATTLAVVEIDGTTIRPYHVGDSMILVVGQRGKTKMCTVSHSPVGYAVEAGLLDPKEAIHHEDRHLVSNIVGSSEMRIEVGRTLELHKYDTVVLGSDGLFDNLHLEEITDFVRKGPLPLAAETLVTTCRHRMCQREQGHPSKPDDLTFLLYRSSL
jgi:serine/threonine protein phosphatase PrpC